MHTLRSRLILSHILPLVIVAPLLTALSTELMQQAEAVAQLVQRQPAVWDDAEQAQLLVEVLTAQAVREPEIRIELVRPDGELLATNLTTVTVEGERAPVDLADLGVTLEAEEGYVRLQADLAQAFVPIFDAEEQIIGLVGLTTELDDVMARVPRLRNLLVAAVVAELFLGLLIGLGLALNFERDLRAMTAAVAGISHGKPLERLPERGPDELRALFQAYNTMIERLKTLEETRRQLLANMVHELGRPLGALHAAMQALAQARTKMRIYGTNC